MKSSYCLLTKPLILLVVLAYTSYCYSQESEITYGAKIFSMTTIVYTYYGPITKQASAFYYQTGKETYLVSNRHVFYSDEKFPDSIIFNLRMEDTIKKKDVWYPITVYKDFLKTNLKLHPNRKIDVASILINDLWKQIKAPNVYRVFPVNQPDTALINLENPEIGDDILIVGYPKGYYDEYNLIPVMKSGIISSFYRLDFNNLPCFLIDSRLFHGSSGSIVISKYKPMIFSNKEPMFAIDKDFTFLGIYSGEPYLFGPRMETDEEIRFSKEYMDLGIVWYPWVLNELK